MDLHLKLKIYLDLTSDNIKTSIDSIPPIRPRLTTLYKTSPDLVVRSTYSVHEFGVYVYCIFSLVELKHHVMGQNKVNPHKT